MRRLRRALLPLRIFLGLAFLYAGLDKLTDPTFLLATGPGSIGSQLQGFLFDSPLAPLVRAFALPAPVAVGALIALAEIGVGLGTVTGLLYRLSTLGGLLLALLFWLTASWATHPFYYGADLPFAAGWLVLLLAGPIPPSLATYLERYLPPQPATRPIGEVLGRRDVLALGLQLAVLATASAALGAVAWVATGGPTRQRAPRPTASPGPTGTPVPPPTPGSTGAYASASVSGLPGASPAAFVTDVKPHEALAVTDPISGDPAFLYRLASGRVVCYDALCTHEGCPVEFQPQGDLLVCPCHGAVFDPARGARVLAGPTREPLPELPLTIDPMTGAITISA